jgi:outer membrane protein OmpA-like peptidoglycan-associated protein
VDGISYEYHFLKNINMKNVKIISLSIALLMICSAIQAQSFGNRLGNAVKNSAEKTTIRKAEKETEKAVNKAIDDALTPENNNNNQNNSTQKGNDVDQNSDEDKSNKNDKSDGTTSNLDEKSKKEEKKSPEMAYNKFDFVAGDVIIFEDNMVGEKVGEFPSKWDLMEGEAEIAKMNGENVIVLKKDCYIRPLMKNIKNYLGDVYTIEFDYWFTLSEEGKKHNGNYWIGLKPEDKPWAHGNDFKLSMPGQVMYWAWARKDPEERRVRYDYSWKTPDDESRSGSREELLEPGNWVHVSLSFNKRAMKIYINENRIANIPNMAATNDWFSFWYGGGDDSKHGYIRNFRIAKGAVPLYDRMMTDGKIITYGITFDIGKSTIKPESMGELNRIAELMNENQDLKFSVEGHTDNTGNAATNQTLSEARSQAVVDKLIEMGIDKNRLKAAGKGQTSPLADNNTDEGKAKNRRVEFVKIN